MQVTPHDTWENLKSFVLERARQLAMDGQSKPLNLAEATVLSPETDITEELNSLVNPSAEEVLAAVNRRMNGKFVKAPWKRTSSAKPEKDQNDYKPPTTKEGKVLCANCAAEGHDKSKCKKAVVDMSQRPCFICKKSGHRASKCPMRTEAHAKLIEQEEEEGEQALTMDVEPIPSSSRTLPTENSFEALAEDSESEVDPEEDDEDHSLEAELEEALKETQKELG